ncbi:ABC transporter permease [Dongia sp.]|uniref:ABC transporter permease n=1 Tax=Dongia sp. TaxID=1977262 RepID=UPI0035AE1887
MTAYILRRLLRAALILVGVSIITYLLLFLLPADPARQVAGRTASVAQVEQVRQQLGLDRPVWEQYGRYVARLATGDLGRSYVQRSQVSELIGARLPATLLLMVGAICAELVIGLTLGTFAAFRRNTRTDQAMMLGAFVFVSTPQFFLGYLLLFIFAVGLGWFPIGGYGTWQQLVLPSLTLGLIGAGWYARMMRSSIIEVLRQDYVRTARAKGLARARIVAVHIVPNALLPILAMIGLDIGAFMGGIVVVESVFGWPGIGQLTWQAIQQIDIPIIMGVTLVSACAIVIGNLLADLVAPLIDPRIRLK